VELNQIGSRTRNRQKSQSVVCLKKPHQHHGRAVFPCHTVERTGFVSTGRRNVCQFRRPKHRTNILCLLRPSGTQRCIPGIIAERNRSDLSAGTHRDRFENCCVVKVALGSDPSPSVSVRRENDPGSSVRGRFSFGDLQPLYFQRPLLNATPTPQPALLWEALLSQIGRRCQRRGLSELGATRCNRRSCRRSILETAATASCPRCRRWI